MEELKGMAESIGFRLSKCGGFHQAASEKSVIRMKRETFTKGTTDIIEVYAGTMNDCFKVDPTATELVFALLE